jgi:hypothetical protein
MISNSPDLALHMGWFRRGQRLHLAGTLTVARQSLLMTCLYLTKRRTRSLLESTGPGYRFLRRTDNAIHGTLARPRASWDNAVLRMNQFVRLTWASA